MISLCREIRTREQLDVVADYLSDFTTIELWDPRTERCDQLGGRNPDASVGSRYADVPRLLGRRIAFVHTVNELERRHRIVWRGVATHLVTTDTMASSRTGTDTVVVHGTVLRFSGPVRRIESVLAPLVRRAADERARCLSAALTRL